LTEKGQRKNPVRGWINKEEGIEHRGGPRSRNTYGSKKGSGKKPGSRIREEGVRGCEKKERPGTVVQERFMRNGVC